jgi:hypothetical protein
VTDGCRVYISGPIMFSPDRGRLAFAEAEDALESLGFDAVNPKSVDACADGDCEKLENEVEKGMPHSWACFLKYDLIAMLECESILMLPGWERSHGARLEMNVAASVGMRVMYFIDGDISSHNDGQSLVYIGGGC